MNEADFIWMNGEIVRWEDAKVHVLSHALHYGSGVFEGIRAYETERGTAVFRHRDHLERLRRSAELYYMELPYTLEKLREATHELIRANKLRSCYIRPLAFRGYGEMGLFPLNAPVDVVIAVWPWGAYLGEEGQRNGIRCKVASWRRMSPDSFIPQAKACGQYLNSILAKVETAKAGYDEAILLDEHGNVCEGSGENIFMVRDGEISTPPATASILDGITRQLGDPDRRRPRLRGRRARHRPRRALPGRRGVPDGHRGRGGAGARDRRPPLGAARRDHAGDPDALLRGHQGQARRSTSSGSTSSSRRVGADATEPRANYARAAR